MKRIRYGYREPGIWFRAKKRSLQVSAIRKYKEKEEKEEKCKRGVQQIGQSGRDLCLIYWSMVKTRRKGV